ncbi:hypothetical protein ACOMHN_012142 [Nucella lapillus]
MTRVVTVVTDCCLSCPVASLGEAALLAPPPGMPTITGLPEAQLVPSAQALQHQQALMVPSSMSSVMVPAGSLASSLPTINPGQPGAPSMLLNTTLSMAHMPGITSLPISSQPTIQLQPPPAGLELGQQQLMMNQAGGPPQPLQVNLGPPQMSAQTSLPMSITSLAPAPGPTMHLVSQSAPVAPPPAPVSGPAQPQPFTIYSPDVVSSGPVLTPGGMTSLVMMVMLLLLMIQDVVSSGPILTPGGMTSQDVVSSGPILTPGGMTSLVMVMMLLLMIQDVVSSGPILTPGGMTSLVMVMMLLLMIQDVVSSGPILTPGGMTSLVMVMMLLLMIQEVVSSGPILTPGGMTSLVMVMMLLLMIQEVVSSGPILTPGGMTSLVVSSTPSPHIYSLATSTSIVSHTKDPDPVRRRFTEEKDDKIPDSLLGYQHGPPHLVNLVCSSPPPGCQSQATLHPAPPAFLPGQPSTQPGPPLQAAPQPGLAPPHPQSIAVLSAQPGLPQQPQPDCRDIDDGGYGLDYSEDIIPDNDNVSNEAQPITGGQSQGIAAQEPKRKKAKSRPASASEGQLELQAAHPGLQAAMAPGHPTNLPTYSLPHHIQMQTLHALTQPPNSLSPVSQAYHAPPAPMPADDHRFGMAVSSSAGMMPPPPPPTSMGMSPSGNGEQGNVPRQLMPPPARHDPQPWGAPPNGLKRGMSGEEGERDQDRKRRKENGFEEEAGSGQSPSAQSESPKPGTPTQGPTPRPHSYSPLPRGEGPPLHDPADPHSPHLPPPPPPPHPHHPQAAFSPQGQQPHPPAGQFEAGLALPPHHIFHPNPHAAPFDPAGQPPPPPLHQQFAEPSPQPPPLPLHFQEMGQQFAAPANSAGELGTFHPAPGPHQTQGEMPHPFPPAQGPGGAFPHGVGGPGELGPAVNSQPHSHSHSPYPPFSQALSQPGPQTHFVNTMPVSSSPNSFLPSPAPHFMPQRHHHHHHPHGPPPPPPPPPPSPQYQHGHGPPQGYWN